MTTEKPLTPYGNYVQKLEQENAQLKEQVEELTQQVFDLNRLGANFERENAQLKDRNEALNKLNNEYELLNGKLKSELEAANKRIAAQVIGNTEPVYDEKWLDNVLMEYADKKYGLFGENYIVAVANLGSWAALDTKTSANVIIAALAKKLNPLFEVDKNQSMFCIQRVHEEVTTGMTYLHMVDCAHIFTSEQAAQKAIDILNSINSQVLKNYFQL
jgi:hypothetical protein